MSVNDLLEGKYLTAGSFPRPVRVVIRELKRELVGRQDGPKERKGILYFQGYDKGVVLNKTNTRKLVQILGTDDEVEWIGKAVILRNDETVEFGGKITGGIRFSAVPARGSANLDPVPMRQPGEDDEVFTA
jgi:hypothetical protein